MLPTRTCVVLIAATLIAGCGESGRMKVDGKVARSTAALASEDGELVLGEGRLVVESVRVRVSEIEFEGGSDDEREAELGSATIQLVLDGSPTTVSADSVEAGSYHTIGIELRTGGDSILVEGTYDGSPFTYQSNLDFEVEFPIDPQVNVPADGEATVGLTFDVGSWFSGADGALFDPSDGGNHGAIEENIQASMAAIGDIELEDDGDEGEDD